MAAVRTSLGLIVLTVCGAAAASDEISFLGLSPSTWNVASSQQGHLIGADGDQLVFRSFDHLEWLKEPEPEAVASAPSTR